MIETIPYRRSGGSALCLILSLTGCATYDPGDPDMMFNEIIVYNRGPRDIANVEIRVEKLNRVFACSAVKSKRICSNTFSTMKYEGNTTTISWTDSGSTHTEGPMAVEMPDSYSTHINHSAIVELDSDGVHSVYFRENASWM